MADLIIVGGGLAGVAAAIGAARQGIKPLLIERYGFLGGMATAGLVNPFCHTLGAGGLYRELEKKLIKRGVYSERAFCPETLKLILDEWLEEEGVEVLLHAQLLQVERKADYIDQIIIAGKGGQSKYRARMYIDATGDGDLSALAGLKMALGRAEDELCQPMTTNFQVAGVDSDNLDREQLNRAYSEAKKRGRITNPRENLLWFRTIHPDVIHFNTTRVVQKNPLSSVELTQAEQESRRQIGEIVSWLQEEVEPFKNSYLTKIATQIGVRESRKLQGSYILTEEDVLGLHKFPDVIARCSYSIDIHNPSGTGTRLEGIPYGEWYEIPYRTLHAPEVKNLLLAGRCISATHEAQASLRIMPTCMVIGQAAGVALALALEKNCTVQEVPVELLQTILRNWGAEI